MRTDRTLRRAALITLALLVPTLAAAQRPVPRAPGEVALSAPPVRLAGARERRALDARPAWSGFVARHGAWSAVWNARTGSPHRAFGRGIPLPGFADRPAAVEAAVRGFVAAHPDLFGTPELATVRVQRVRTTWYLSFRQTVGGAPLLFSDWEFRVGANGKLFSFGADAHRDVPAPLAGPARRLPAPVARQAARAGLPFDATRDRIEGGDVLALLPVASDDGLTYRPVLETRVVTLDPPHDWHALVDATSGEVLWRVDRVRSDIGGHVTGQIHAGLPTDPLVPGDLPHLRVNVGPTPVNTDAGGLYSAPATGTVTVSAALRGAFCDVRRQDGVADAAFSAPASDPATVDIPWTGANAHDAERDGYYHVSLVHDFMKSIDPGMVRLDYPIVCKVNINNTCNAFYSTVDSSLNFYRAGGSCPNTATMRDVVYHEYGHAVNDKQYQQAGLQFGMNNGALHEGLADVLACLLLDDPVVGRGFFGPGTSLRTIDNTLRWPGDGSPDPHITGLIVAGAFWDLRQSAGLAVARQLSHFARYGVPDDPEDGNAMSEYFVETVVADDDDADLGNGTPHFAEIVAAFNAHGIGTGFFIDFVHTPMADQPTAGPYTVRDTVRWTGPFGGLAGPPVLHYTINSGPVQNVAMTAEGEPDVWVANIPPQDGSVVSYWVSATDVYGETVTDPPFAPAAGTHRFLAGPATIIAEHAMENEDPLGWTAGYPGDNATTGIWYRDKPNGTWVGFAVPVQPDEDHSPQPGFVCWITGNAGLTEPVGANDVDGGHTTLVSPMFDATAGGLVNPAISYWRWYTNDLGGSPGLDVWRVEITGDGGKTWVPVENTTEGRNQWTRVLFRIADYVTPSDMMQMRFIAEDIGAGSLVEAGVDDFLLVGFDPNPVAVEPFAGAARRVSLAPPWPSPSSGVTTLRFSLATAGEASLAIYDLRGRTVRTLFAGARDAGEHTIAWDGRNDGGRALPTGAYFVRLVAGAEVARRMLVLTR